MDVFDLIWLGLVLHLEAYVLFGIRSSDLLRDLWPRYGFEFMKYRI